MPTVTEETQDPAKADEIYQACLDVLRVEAREHPEAYPGVFQANVNYGFRRNFWAIRWWAVAAGIAGATAGGLHMLVVGPTVGAVAVAFLSAGTAFWSAFRAGPAFVQPAAFAYAIRLLESAEHMARNQQVHSS